MYHSNFYYNTTKFTENYTNKILFFNEGVITKKKICIVTGHP